MQKFLLNNKIKLNFVLLTMFFSISLNAQQWNTTDWKFSTPRQFGFTAFDVHFINNTNGILVGSEGGIAVTTDGGVKWKYGAYTFPSFNGFTTRQSFNDVHYASTSTAYAVGNAGLMVKTSDAGQTWNFVNTPFQPGNTNKNINAVWFLNKDTGYIGGTYLDVDSMPKLYITKNGGATWDSLAAPVPNGKSRVGYVNNVNVPSVLDDVTAKAKEIYRIEFLNANLGYICGTASSLFPRVSVSVNAPTAANPCLPNTGSLTGSASNAALLWKFQNGVLTDYSISKERLGFQGIVTNTVVCNTSYNGAQISPTGQQYRAMKIINDSVVIMMSFNNNCVLRVNTGVNDKTPNINNANALEPGKYLIYNFPFPPTAGPNIIAPIPAVQTLLASNPYHIKRAANGDLYASSNFGRLWASSDTGKNWIEKASYLTGQNYSTVGFWAMDILPNGKIITAGTGGVVNEFTQGGVAASSNVSNYILENPTISTEEIEFADCNNGIAAGGSTITVTENGAKTWVAKNRTDFANSNTSILGLSYIATNKAYFATNNGTIYKSIDKGTTLDPVYQDVNYQMNDVQAIGNDTVYAIGYSSFSVATASRKSTFFRSYNNGVTWSAVDIIPAGPFAPSTAAPNLSKMYFADRNVGFAVGTINSIYRTGDGGTTWTRVSPFPAINHSPTGFASSSVSYKDVYATDANTIFAVGNMFTAVNNRRIYKSIDGGLTWADISGNLPTLVETGNLNGVLFHDANNGYVVLPGGVMIRTTNGGTSWTVHIAPSSVLTEHLAFAPRIAPPGTNMANRRLFVSGFGIQAPVPILEFGNPTLTQVSTTETSTVASCSNTTAGSITVTATGGLAPYLYSIDGGAPQTSNIITGLNTGNHTLRIMSQACDTLVKTINIGFNNNLVLTKSNDTTVCKGAPVQLNAGGNAATYIWSPATNLNATNISNPLATVNASVTYTVTATLNTCVLSKNVIVSVGPNPYVTAGPDFTILSGDNVQLLGSGNTNITNIAWTPNATITSGAATFTPITLPTATTTYTVTVKDANNCISTDDAVVTVVPYCVKVLEAFTPNGDGINDRWQVTTNAACTNQVIVNIYNRYGSLVYNNENYNNTWDGTYKGKAIPDGTYYYKIKYQLINGKTVLQQGNVTIIR